jgi:hypothetical protein
MGGLGNQMFQYALGRHLSILNNKKLKFDISWYENEKIRRFSLEKFNIKIEIASVEELNSVNFPTQKFIKRINNFTSLKSKKIIGYYSEKEKFVFDPEILTFSKNIYLEGSWQNEKYFIAIRDVLIRDFTLKNPLIYEVAEKIEENKGCSVSIHFRRGDYFKNPQTNSIHGVCSLDFYKNAIRKICTRIYNPNFFIFSDDMEWVKENLHINNKHYFVDSDTLLSDVDELFLMSRCSNHIIANSTFSWWGAWLSQNPDKIVIAPQRWMRDTRYDYSDVLPNKWIKI